MGNVLFLYVGCDQTIDVSDGFDHVRRDLVRRQKTSSSRKSNAKEFEDHYPRMVGVFRIFTKNDEIPHSGTCGGK